MKRTYQFVSDYAVVIFDAPDGLEEAEADSWAEDNLADIVQKPDDFWMDEAFEREEE